MYIWNGIPRRQSTWPITLRYSLGQWGVDAKCFPPAEQKEAMMHRHVTDVTDVTETTPRVEHTEETRNRDVRRDI